MVGYEPESLYFLATTVKAALVSYEQNNVHFCATPSSDKFVNCRFPTVKAAVASYVQEVKLLANQLENLIRERDKLRLDIQVQCMTFYLFLTTNMDIY